MSEERSGFLSRWSRLKRGAEPAASATPDPTGAAPAPPEEALPDGPSLEERIAELPGIDALAPGQSVAVFMQSWVPAALRNAALQRMWLLDPAIRDYVDPALDYAYDYNTLGAAPGFGPMDTSCEAVQEVAEMFDRALGRGAADGAEDARPVAEARPDPAGEPKAPAAAARPRPLAPSPADGEAAAQDDTRAQNDLRPIVRRHGRALPG